MAVDMGYLMCTVLRTVRYECADVARRVCCGVWYVVPNGYCEVQMGVLSLFSRFRSLCLSLPPLWMEVSYTCSCIELLYCTFVMPGRCILT